MEYKRAVLVDFEVKRRNKSNKTEFYGNFGLPDFRCRDLKNDVSVEYSGKKKLSTETWNEKVRTFITKKRCSKMQTIHYY